MVNGRVEAITYRGVLTPDSPVEQNVRRSRLDVFLIDRRYVAVVEVVPSVLLQELQEGRDLRLGHKGSSVGTVLGHGPVPLDQSSCGWRIIEGDRQDLTLLIKKIMEVKKN